MIFCKSLATYNWAVWHKDTCTSVNNFYRLNTTDALQSYSTIWGASLPTSSLIGVTGDGCASANNDAILYAFAEVEGFSKFGSYTGNGSTDGPFIYTGFRPAWVVWKKTNAVGNWILQDTTRATYNASDTVLYPDLNAAESVGGGYPIDVLSNGFKMRTSASYANASGSTYIYAAFAENPFKNALAR